MHDVRRMKTGELDEALELIRSVFLEFEAPDYPEEGTKTFLEFTENENIRQAMNKGELKFWVCRRSSGIIGVIAMRNKCHVCMLFVHRDFHRQGIAKSLTYNALMDLDCKAEITVNSSPYGADFYHSIGFKDTDKLTSTNGIEYVPMKAKCSIIISTIENSYMKSK